MQINEAQGKMEMPDACWLMPDASLSGPIGPIGAVLSLRIATEPREPMPRLLRPPQTWLQPASQPRSFAGSHHLLRRSTNSNAAVPGCKGASASYRVTLLCNVIHGATPHYRQRSIPLSSPPPSIEITHFSTIIACIQ